MKPQIPIYAQIQNFIRGDIASGRYAPGDRLPSEPELAQRFATTRATVAKALQQLVFEGIISRRIGSGTFVSGNKVEDRVDTALLETFEQHMLASGETLEYQLLTFRRTRASVEVARELGLRVEAPVYLLERLRRVNGRVLGLEIRYLPEGIARRIDEAWLHSLSIQDILREKLGLRIGKLDNAISAAVASVRIARLLDTGKGQPLLVRAHTIFGLQGQPLLYGRALYKGDFRIRYTLRSLT